jgi:hypothetical protein
VSGGDAQDYHGTLTITATTVAVTGALNAGTLQQGGVGAALVTHTHGGTYPNVAAGAYTGDGAADRHIPTGSFTPRLVVLAAQNPTLAADNISLHMIDSSAGSNTFGRDGVGNFNNQQNRVGIRSGGFNVNIDNTNQSIGANRAGVVYGWVAYSG